MRIFQARVRNYRSVLDSNEFTLEPGKTILVGINESGKTALLKAIQTVNPPEGVGQLDFLADYPRAHLNDIQTGKAKIENIKVAEVSFALDDADRAALPASLAAQKDASLTWHRYLDNVREYSLTGIVDAPTMNELRQDLVRLKAHLEKQAAAAAIVTAFENLLTNPDSAEITGDLATSLTGLVQQATPLVDEDDEKETARLSRLHTATEYDADLKKAVGILSARTPLLVYYSTYFTVRPRIDLESLAARQARGDIDDDYDFGNLCLLKFLGFTAQELSELGAGAPVKPPQYEQNDAVREAHDQAVQEHQRKLDARQYQLNAAGVQLTHDLRRVWGDEQLTLRLIADGQYLKVMVVDDLGVEVELDQRSDGFRWLVSFFIVFRAQAADDLKNAVLLLDEPGLSLHALKQQEFRKTISLLGEDNQIIYSTHSPFMVGSDELDLVRIVEMPSRQEGTKVHTRVQVDDPRSIFPLQAALGYELAQTLFAQKKNLVCEGVTDMFYLNAVNSAAEAENESAFKGKPAIIPAGTASKVAYFCTIYAGQNLDVAALLDSDNAGDQAAAQDALTALLSKKAILRVADFLATPYRGAEIEDLFRSTLAERAKDLGWDSTATIAAQPTRPIMEILAAEHGAKSVSKWRLSKSFMSWLGQNGYSALDSDERAAWGKLVVAVNKAL